MRGGGGRLNVPRAERDLRSGESTLGRVCQRGARQTEPEDARIVWGQVYFDLKDSPLIAAALWSRERSRPVEQVVARGSERYSAEIFLLEVGDLAVDALERGLYAESSHSVNHRDMFWG